MDALRLFKKETAEKDNPWLNARREWNAHEGSLLASRRMWQFVGILSLLIALSAVGGIIAIGQQSKFIPYVVQIDRIGQNVAVSRADRAAPVDNRVLHATIASFITDARMVTPDATVQRNAVFRVYALLSANDPSTVKMNEWLNGSEESSPFKRAAKETVSVEITSVLPQSTETWQVDWSESVRDRQGIPKSTYRMRALLTVYTVPPTSQTSEEQIRRNPLGIYIKDFSWSRQIGDPR